MTKRTVQTQAIITYEIEEDHLEHYGVRDGDWNALDIGTVARIDGAMSVEELLGVAVAVDLNPTSWKFVQSNRTDEDGVTRIDDGNTEEDMAVGKNSSVQKAGDLVDDQKQRDAAGQPNQEEVTSQQKRAADEANRGDTVDPAHDKNDKAKTKSEADHGDENLKGRAAGEKVEGSGEDKNKSKQGNEPGSQRK